MPGEVLLIPFKRYHHFFAEKIQASSGLYKAAWIIANVASGIFVYPIFGLFALIGMLIKSSGIKALRQHNQEAITDLNAQHEALQVEESRFAVIEHSSKGNERYVFREFKITRANAEAGYREAADAIKTCNRQLRKIYVESMGSIDIKNGTGEIAIRLMTDAPNGVKQRLTRSL